MLVARDVARVRLGPFNVPPSLAPCQYVAFAMKWTKPECPPFSIPNWVTPLFPPQWEKVEYKFLVHAVSWTLSVMSNF